MIQPDRSLSISSLPAQDDKVTVENVRRGIATRLEKCCSDLREEDFVALVDKMTTVQLGFRTQRLTPPEPARRYGS